MHLTTLGEDERIILKKRDIFKETDFKSLSSLPLFEGSANAITLISESGLYKVVLRAEKATARPFQDWVTREVLPSIRKTGSYTAPGKEPPAPEVRPMLSRAEMVAPYGSQMYQGDDLDLVALVGRQEARIDALIALATLSG